MARETPYGKNSRDPFGDPEGLVGNPNELKNHASLVILVKDCADLLERHFGGWLWAITPDEFGGVVHLHSMRCSGEWGYTIKISSLQNDPQHKRLFRAAGELLERFGFAPRRYDRDAWLRAHRHLGQLRADVSDLPAISQRNFRTHQIQKGLQNGTARILTDDDLRSNHAAA